MADLIIVRNHRIFNPHVHATQPGSLRAGDAALTDAQADGWAAHVATDDLVALCWALVHGLAALHALGVGEPGNATSPLTSAERLIRTQLTALSTGAP